VGTHVPPAPDLAYDLSAWSHDARQSLHMRLREARITPQWRGTTLVVPATSRADVDRHIAGLTGGHAGSATGVATTAPAGAPAGGGSPAAVPAPPGWYPDPWQVTPVRWWDGLAWTGYTAAPSRERAWFPPRRRQDDTPGLEGGGLALAGFLAAEVLAVALALAAIALGATRHSTGVLVASQLGLWAALLTACVLAVRRHGTGSLRQLGLTRVGWRDAGVGLVAAAIGRLGTVVLVAPFIPLLPNRTVRTNGFTTQLHRDALTVILVVAIVTVGAPFVEELFFRGLVQSVFTRRWGTRVAVFAQAGCFAVVHYQVGMSLAEVAVTFVTIGSFGVYLGVLRWRYERLAPGMVAHAAFNLVAVALVLSLT
jgi:membrane protease YdiL (CAAX protease family)